MILHRNFFFFYHQVLRKILYLPKPPNEGKWYFSVVDVIEALTDNPDPSTYWRVLKNRLKKEGNETVTICNAFKLPAKDGKMRLKKLQRTLL